MTTTTQIAKKQAPKNLNLLDAFNLAQPCIMAVLNITPDSFSDGNYYNNKPQYHLLKIVEQYQKQGAGIIDIGAESTRPGASIIAAKQQIERIKNLISAIKRHFDIVVSIDTTQLKVMQYAVEQGVDIINDVSALTGDGVMQWIAAEQVGCILMHRSAVARTMQQHIHYPNGVVTDVYNYLAKRIKLAMSAGITADRLCVDPGFGFGKTDKQNIILLRSLRKFGCYGSINIPVLAGLSRKSLLQKICNQNLENRLSGSLGLAMVALLNGANIIRVHDVVESKAIIDIFDAVSGNLSR